MRSDTVARYAGDEFTMILRHIVQRDDVMRIAEKIVRVMEVPLTLDDGSELHMTASIGVSFYPDDATSAERLLKHADVAMYSAKGLGRNNFQSYVAVPEESHQQRLALEAKLRLAEKNGELRVYYQPQVETESEDISGMEALIRWEHPELGMISPGIFHSARRRKRLDHSDRRMGAAHRVRRCETLAGTLRPESAHQREPVGGAVAPAELSCRWCSRCCAETGARIRPCSIWK